MKRWELLLALAGALTLALSAWSIRRAEVPHRDVIIATGACHMPATILEPAGTPRGTAVVLHGLAADRRIMRPIGEYLSSEEHLRVYLFDLSGHGDNTDAFTFANADRCSLVTLESMVRSGEVDPTRTILVGHSMGGAIAIRAADREPVAGTIALSPAPMPLPQRMPANLLVFSAQFDIPLLKNAARVLAAAAAGDRTTTDDFLEARAFHLETVPFSDHVSLLDDPRVLRQIGSWVFAVLERGMHEQSSFKEWDAHGRESVPAVLSAAVVRGDFMSILGTIGILALFPSLASFTARSTAAPPNDSLPASVPPTLALAEAGVCALAAALLLKLFVPLAFLHLYTGDYLASALLIFGVLLLALNRRAVKQSLRVDARSFLAAAALGFAVMLSVGAWLNWQTADLWLNAPRWLRFAALLPIAWIFCFAEEVMLGPVRSGWARAARFALSLALRAELWLACVLTYYALASGQVLILILVASLALFSILQRLAADALRRRTGSATAAALFGAILAAWFIAAIFPLT